MKKKKKSIVKRNDICKDKLIKRENMGELTPEILTKFRRYARDKKAELFAKGLEGDEHEAELNRLCGAWLRDKKPSRMEKSNKRRRNSSVHKAKAIAYLYDLDWRDFYETPSDRYKQIDGIVTNLIVEKTKENR